MPRIITISGQRIKPGEEKMVSLNIASLPSRTSIETPIIVSRSEKDGPVLLLMAGLHGDEINGVEILRRMVARKFIRPESGTVICVPVMNIYGFLNFSREVPDGKDVNRSFPGTVHGSLASQVAYHTMKDILPLIDCGLDFHTGGAKRANFPQVRCLLEDEESLKLARAFSPPFILNSKYRNKSLRKFAGKHGKHILVYEGGESQRFDEMAINEGIAGARRVMRFLGMVRVAPATLRSPVVLNDSVWLRARTAGIFHAGIENGAFIKKGQRIGSITDPFGEYETKLTAPVTGYVIGLNHNPVVNHGDALLNIGINEEINLTEPT